MSRERHAQIASAVLGMRTPLARVELAASQLDRDGATPRARELARCIREAVIEMDRRIETSLRALLPAAPASVARACGNVLEEVLARVGDVLGARGLRCALRPDPPDPVIGDPDRLRRAALCLLRSAGGVAGSGGTVSIGLEDAPGRYGVSVDISRGGPDAGATGLEPLVAAAREFALAHEAEIDVRWCPGSEPSILRAALWFSRPPESPASGPIAAPMEQP